MSELTEEQKAALRAYNEAYEACPEREHSIQHLCGLHAVLKAGMAKAFESRPIHAGSREAIEQDYQAWRATRTEEELAAWDARYDENGRAK